MRLGELRSGKVRCGEAWQMRLGRVRFVEVRCGKMSIGEVGQLRRGMVVSAWAAG